ncbi:MAG: FimV/HubP family polar landmark protein [Thiobacillus sp.]
MKLKRFTSRLMAAGLIALPLLSHAAGLGNLSVTSALGQPLAAEIELIAADKAELDSLAATLASDQAFRDARVEYAPVLSTLRFAVVKKPNGKAVLKVTSSRPVNDPFIDMLIELNWSSGRLVREYTLLLDPPGIAKTQTVKPAVVTPAQTVVTPAPRPAPVAAAEPAPESDRVIKARPAPAPQDSASKTPNGDYTVSSRPSPAVPDATPDAVRVKRGDTLATIAKRVRPEGIALEQALVGLYRENTDAFAGKNINRLKAGKTLKVPTPEAFAAIDGKEARREIQLQTADWQAYRQKLADAVVAAPAADQTEPGQAASGKITPKVEDKAAPATPAGKDVLKLSKVTPPVANNTAAQKAAEAQALQDKMRAQEEDATAREKALKESSSRVSALEKQVQDMQALVKMKEEAARAAEQRAAEQAAAAATTPTPAATATAPAPAPVAAPPVAAQPTVPPIVVPPVEQQEAKAPWYSILLDNPLYWAAGAALIGLGGLLWWMTSAGRRRKPVTALDDSIMTGGEIHPNTVIGAAAGGNINTGDTSFLTDFSQAGLGTIDTHDVDPIAEAEVYMAYGRDAQAEEILKEAILKNPDRHEIRMKLLEIYAARRNTAAFETIAGELYAAVGNKSNSLWDKAAEMGRSIDPTNPLYGDVQAGVPTPKPAAPKIEQPKFEPPKVETVAATAAIAGGAMAFDTQAAPSSKPEPEMMDFEPTMPYVPPQVEAPVAPAHVESSINDLDFDLSSLDMPEPTTNDVGFGLDSHVDDNKFDFSGLDLDLGDGSNDVELDDVGTKLDLARAYVEMGDKEGAREILNEVIAEGNDKQKTDAKGILVTLA